ncbi:MAG: right-handed parallel beta-helix repeat-containing protein [Saprospiraceae bacterium]
MRKIKFSIFTFLMVIVGFFSQAQDVLRLEPSGTVTGPGAINVNLCQGATLNIYIDDSENGQSYSMIIPQIPPPPIIETINGNGGTIAFMQQSYNTLGVFSFTVQDNTDFDPYFVVTVNVVTDPVAPTLTLSPGAGLIPAGTLLSANVDAAGSGGVTGCVDNYEYSVDGGANWLPYVLNDDITTTSYLLSSVMIKAIRSDSDGRGCYAENIYTWTVDSRVHDITGVQSSYYNIQDAINAANTMTGDILEVEPGTYAEEILLNKVLTLRGANVGISAGASPGIRAAESSIDGGFIVSAASTIDGFEILNGRTSGGVKVGVAVATSGVSILNCIIEDVIAPVQSDGISTQPGNNNLTLTNSRIKDNWRGIYLNPGSGHMITSNLIDANNGVGVGIGSDGQSNLTLTGNIISNHTLEGLGASAVGSNVLLNDNEFLNNGISIAHYGGEVIDASCNYMGTAEYSNIYDDVSGKIAFVPYKASFGGSCDVGFAVPSNLMLTHTMVSENILVQFDVDDNDLELRPIPGLDPNIPAQLAQIIALYNALDVAVQGGDPAMIQEAALAVGDDIIAEYYYLDGITKIYLQTIGNNDLIKNKYWQEYLVKTSNPSQKYPKWTPAVLTQVDSGEEYRTSTNPLTGAVAVGWLNPVLGRDLIVKTTFVHNGSVTSISETIAIPAGPIQNLNTGFGYPTIQDAIDDAGTNHRIAISTGTYTGSVNGTLKTVSLVPGNSPGCVTINGDYTLNHMNTLEIEVDGTTPCTDHDNFIINGMVTLDGAILDLDLNYVPTNGDSYTIIENDGVDAIIGQFAQGLSVSQGGHVFQINYSGGDGNDVVITKCTGGVVNVNTAKEFCSIQDAIDDVSTIDNHTISVAAGYYSPLNTILVHKSLTINGPKMNIDPRTISGLRTPDDASEAIIDGGGSLVNIFNITAENVVLNGLQIKNGTGDLITSPNDNPAPFRNIVIKYCIVNNSNGPGDEGIQIYNLDGGGVEYCRVFDVAEDGINLAEGCQNSYIQHNEIYQSSSANGAIYVYDNGPAILIDNNLLYNNPAEFGIIVGRTDGTNFNSNSSDPNNAIVSNNIILGNGNANNVGIYVTTSRVNVINNDVNNCGSTADAAVYFRYNVKDIVATGNIIQNSYRGIKISSGVENVNIPSFLIQNNSFVNNTNVHILNSKTAMLPATCNWLGSTDLATNTLKISGPVTFVPWLSSGIDASPLVVGFQPSVSCGNNVIIDNTDPTHILCGPTTGSIEVTFSGGVAPYNIFWTGGSQTNVSSPFPITPLLAGNYNITVTSANGTTAVSSTTINYKPITNSTDLPNTHYATIQAAINASMAGDVINVCAGTYLEDVLVNKAITVSGAGASSTTVSGPIGGASAAFTVAASGVTIEGFTITREGNNLIDWNNPGLNSAGIAIQGQTVDATVQNNIIIGNRTGIDINNSNDNNILNNQIDFNRTGMILRNQTDNTTMTGNFVTDNWTAGILFLDASGGTNVPVQTALNSNFNNNNISGNWYGDIVDRQSGGSLPAAGTNIKNFECNWYGVTSPVVSTANSSEPGYAAQIPVLYGGSSTSPGGQPNILGPASANFDYVSWGVDVSDDDLVTMGWQITPGSCTGTPVMISSAVPTDKLYCVNGNILVTFTGGTASYNISWTGGSDTNISSPYTITNLTSGVYGITITDMNGSTATSSATILNLPVRNTTTTTYYATIGAAISAAVVGNVIDVCDGTYNERVVLDKSLTLQGQSEVGTVLDGTGLVGSGSGITINNGITNVNINTLTVQNYTGSGPNSYAGIYAIGGNNNLTVQNATLKDNVGGSGFYANGPIDMVLLNNLDVSGHTNVAGAARGIVIWNGLKSNITITNCDVYNNNCCGIELQDGSGTGVNISNNNVYNNADNGIGVVGLSGPGANLINMNTMTNNGRFGIEMKNPNGNGNAMDPGSIVISNNTVTRNVAIVDTRDIAGIAVMRRGVLGLNADVPKGVYVNNNTVSGYTQPSASEGFGIVIGGIDHTVINNNLSGNDVGIQQQAGHLPYPGDGNQDLQGDEYFGRDNSPYTCANVVSPNTLSNAIDTRNVGAIGADGYVTNANTGRTFCSIQSAISHSTTLAGHTLEISEGTFAENVIVNKTLTLQGANANVECSSRGTESLIMPSSGIPLTINVNGVTINGLGISGASSTSGILCGNTSDLNILHNKIFDLGNTVTTSTVYGINYTLGSNSHSNVSFTNNCISNIASTFLTGNSAGAIIVAGSSTTGVLTDINIERNIINGVQVNTSNWPTGKIAYGIQMNVGGSGSYMSTTGKTVDAVINQNEISNLSGHISTAIGMEGNTEDAVVTNNAISYLAATKNGVTRAGGGYDLSGIKFENNKYVSTVTVKNNSFATNTFTHSVGPDLGYAVSNYVPTANGGNLTLDCNWFGTAIYNEIEDNVSLTGKILNKDNCTTTFTPYLSTGTDGAGIGFQPTGMCNGTPVVISIDSNTPERCYSGLGALTTLTSGGVLPYTYLWSNGAMTADISSLTAGSYTVTVTDFLGSTATATTIILYYPVENQQTGNGYSTIQAAINDVLTLDGHTIHVCAGTYNENVVVNKDVTISGAGPTMTIISNAAPCVASVYGIAISANNATVQNLKVTGYFYGLVVSSSGVTIDNVESVNNCSAGLELGNGTSNLTVVNSKLNNNTTIAKNGLGFRKGTASVVSGFVMNNCEVKGNNQGCAIQKNNGAGGTFDNVSITNSDFSNNTVKGMYFEALTDAVIDGIVMDNSGTDATYGFNNGIDINLKYGAYSNITIKNCEITNCGETGIAADPENPAAITIKARDDAPYNGNPATLSGMILENNLITGPRNGIRFGEFGKISAGATNVSLVGNHIEGPYGHKAIINRTNSDVNLNCNWHGTTDILTMYASFVQAGTGDIVYNTILANGTDGNPTVGFQPSASCNCPSGNDVVNISTGWAYCSIQAAIDDALTLDGNIIEVGPGAYIENIKVNKELTILGPNSAVSGCGGRIGEAIIYPTRSDIDYNTDDGTLVEILASNVAISGFTLDGDNPSIATGKTSTTAADIDVAEGVTRYGTGNNLVISNNIIKNLSYFGITMYDYPTAVPSSGNFVTGNRIADLGTYDNTVALRLWGGGLLMYNNQYISVTNNCMDNVRLGIQTGNYHQANPGTASFQVIENNTINARRRGIFHNLSYSNASPLTFNNNNINGVVNANETVWDGILLASLSVPSTTSGNTINGMSVTNPSEGIEVWNVKNTTPASITGGTISNVATGIFINNYDGYSSNAGDGAHATVSNVNLSASNIGVRLLDNTLSAHAKVNATVSNCTIAAVEGIKIEESVGGPGTVSGNFNDNDINASAVGVNVTGMLLSPTNGLTIDNNDIDLSSQMALGNPTVGVLLTNVIGTDDAIITNNDVSDAFYGYVGYKLNTSPITTISGGNVTGVMQGTAFVNTLGGPLAASNVNVSGINMSLFNGTSINPDNNFHAGVYTFTAGGTTAPTGINLTVDDVTIDGTDNPSQASGGIYLADFSGGGSNVQNVTVSNSTITNNANRGVDARGKVNLSISQSTLTNNGHDAFVSGGNHGFSILAQQNATVNAYNNFITLPAIGASEVFALSTGSGITNVITANNNSILLNGNLDPDSRLARALVGTGDISAECNWWGTGNYQTIQSLTNGNVDFINWLINGTDDDGVTPGFQPVAGSCTGEPIVVSIVTNTPATCFTGNNGALDISVSGGTPSYYYNWSNGAMTLNINTLIPGTYTVTVTDSFGSTGTTSATIGLLPIENVNSQTGYTTIQAAVTAATPGDVIEVCNGTYTEAISVNKNLTINGPNAGTPGNGVRVTEAILQDGSFTIPGAHTVVLDGFHVYQTNTTTPISLSGGSIATVRNNKIERYGIATGSGVRGIEISAGAGTKNIENNLFTGDASAGLFGGHKTWNSAMYVNGAGSTINIVNNIFQNTRTAINLDDYNAGITVSGNTFDNNGTHISFGGVAPTTGVQTLGANDFKLPASAIINLSNVTTSFRLDMTSSTWIGTSFGALPNATLFAIEAAMFHRGRAGRNGLVTYKANNQYVITLNPSLQLANDYAPSGGIINIDAGTFNQKLTITKPLTLQGGTNDKLVHIVDGTGVVGNTRGIEISTGVTDVTIQYLTIQNFMGTLGNQHGGIYAVGPNNNNLTVDNVLIQNNGSGSGFYANGPIDNLDITNSMVKNHGNDARGIVVWNGMKTNINISYNMLENNRCCGIELQDGAASGVNVSYNTIDIGTGDNAIGLTGLDNSIGANSVNNNTITGGGRFGIEIKNPNGGVTVDGNSVMLTSQNGDVRDRGGIVVMRRGVLNPPNIVNANVPDGVTVSNNAVSNYRQTNGGSSSSGFGIVIEGTNHVVTNNTLTNNDVALQLQAGHTPYGAPPVSVDGNQANLNDIYFGRGNSPDLCNVMYTPNTFSGNSVNSPRIVTGGGTGTVQTDITPTVNDPTDQTLCVGKNTTAVTFTGNYVVGVTYNWVNDNSSIGLAANGSGNIASFTALNTTNIFQTATITVTPTANGCTGSPQIFTITVQPSPTIANLVTSPAGYNQNMTSGDPTYMHTICHGEELSTSVPTLISTLSNACGTLRIQTEYISTLPNIPSATIDETFDNVVLAGVQTISPENHTLVNQTITFNTTPYYDVNGNMMYNPGIDVAGNLTQFILTVQPKPTIQNTVTSGVYNQVMVSGNNYAHGICHDTDITTSVPTRISTLANTCGILRIQTQYISTLPNIPSATLDATFDNVVLAGPQTISPENNTGLTQTIRFITTPYYDVNGNMMYDVGIDIAGDETDFILTIHPIPSGTISGTAFVVQNAPTTANLTFTGYVGTAPYTFTYNINGGSTQSISTIAMNNAVTLPHPNGSAGVFVYTLLSVTDANGCEGVVDPMQDMATITVIAANLLPDLSPSIARPLNASFVTGQLKEGYVQFTNGGNGPTYGVTKVRLPKTVGNFNFVINQAATTSAGQSVVNSQCTYVDMGALWEITYPDPIPLGTNIKVGYSLTATGSTGSNGTVTATILNGSGGDSNNANNKAIRRFVIN